MTLCPATIDWPDVPDPLTYDSKSSYAKEIHNFLINFPTYIYKPKQQWATDSISWCTHVTLCLKKIIFTSDSFSYLHVYMYIRFYGLLSALCSLHSAKWFLFLCRRWKMADASDNVNSCKWFCHSCNSEISPDLSVSSLKRKLNNSDSFSQISADF